MALIALFAALPATAHAQAPEAPVRCKGCWKPKVTTKPWQIQLQGRVDTRVKADVFEFDGADNSARTVRTLHKRRTKVICYMNAGAWENFRSDADRFPPEVLGKQYEGYPEERWLDIRRIDLLAPILEARFADCRRKGFDAVDPDNMNGYGNDTGFALTASDQLRFNAWVANTVRRMGMAVGLKNDGDQVRSLVRHFDFAVVESCFVQRLCGLYQPFVKAGKPVYAIEYEKRPAAFCREAERRKFSAIFKQPSLKPYRRTC